MTPSPTPPAPPRCECGRPKIWLNQGIPTCALFHVSPERCADGALPDGPVCPRCGAARGPSGVDGGTWVHLAALHGETADPPSDAPLTQTDRQIAVTWATACVAGECPFADAKDREMAGVILRWEATLAAVLASRETAVRERDALQKAAERVAASSEKAGWPGMTQEIVALRAALATPATTETPDHAK